MSETDAETALRIARLARLEITAQEAERLGAQFARILAAFGSIAALDTRGVEPMTAAAAAEDVTREDRAVPGLDRERLLAAAPERVDDYFGVPRTVGGES